MLKGARHADYKAAERELRTLLNGWDPIGVGSPVDDEYDCLIPGLYKRLLAGEREEELLAFITHELIQHFGLTPDPDADRDFAHELVRWWDGRGQRQSDE